MIRRIFPSFPPSTPKGNTCLCQERWTNIHNLQFFCWRHTPEMITKLEKSAYSPTRGPEEYYPKQPTTALIHFLLCQKKESVNRVRVICLTINMNDKYELST
jgi:hypothetical protein